MKSGQIFINLINRRTREIIRQDKVVTRDSLTDLQKRLLGPALVKRETFNFLPSPVSINYSSDLSSFTDAFDMQIELAQDELFGIKSQDFVEFFIALDRPAAGFGDDKIEGTNLFKHQIGVGYLEKKVNQTTNQSVSMLANGRDLLGHMMVQSTKVAFQNKKLKIKSLILELLKDSYLKNYLDIRGRNPLISDKGAFSIPMLIRSLAGQKKAPILQRYADLGINLVYMNRLGQVEVLGRQGNFGSTARNVPTDFVGTLEKGRNIDTLRVTEDFSKVLSAFTIFWTSGQAEQDISTNASLTERNTDPRSQHVDQPNFRTFNIGELAQLGGDVSADRRKRDIAQSMLRKSNINLNQVVITTSYPYSLDSDGRQIPFIVGQKWRIISDTDEFTSRNRPEGTNLVVMVLAGINYQQSADSQSFQLKFVEEDTLL